MKKLVCLALLFGASACDVPEESAAAPVGPPVEVTAQELSSAYEANEAAAQMKYGKSPLLVSGEVTGITLDFMDKPVVQLDSGNEYMPAQASLVEADQPKAADLSKGQDIKLLCSGVSEVIGAPQLADCAIQ